VLADRLPFISPSGRRAASAGDLAGSRERADQADRETLPQPAACRCLVEDKMRFIADDRGINRKDGNKTVRRDGHFAFSARFGVHRCESGKSRVRLVRFLGRFKQGGADDHDHAQRLAAVSARAGRILHRLSAHRSPVPGRRPGTHVRCLRHLRARRSVCMAWHTHPLGQILIVTAGTGWVQQERGEKQEIRPGDVIWTPPGVKYWHGATPRRP
jgi:mannose-6-phosphate isomerase-like protein (cupin superfamily)